MHRPRQALLSEVDMLISRLGEFPSDHRAMEQRAQGLDQPESDVRGVEADTALSRNLQLGVLKLFKNNPTQQFSIGHVASELNHDRNVASKHLTILVAPGELTMRRVGNGKFYELKRSPLQQTLVKLKAIIDGLPAWGLSQEQVRTLESTYAALVELEASGRPPTEQQQEQLRLAEALILDWQELDER